mmetsp:Transcript_22277/g.52965  ORF Transcript_22277/g.52965 Transcript_22277/m.52965 type:complete len:452 (+) Transcript_22277:205-1560(+)|eukprot:CAMPEP_0197189896 /NCGR_PEP_ID=MMETSP1423-20130617/20602_1 /TAXON_ID=476441 /ORGANISM="Pseudo-nitzschia heimii, Strain UNC1101" /LENGTH=451 /DNA_ID=CAMNT_0042642141 /DNA_START=160 /DNA_END=1515 /DNA_ORIENTATION=+
MRKKASDGLVKRKSAVVAIAVLLVAVLILELTIIQQLSSQSSRAEGSSKIIGVDGPVSPHNLFVKSNNDGHSPNPLQYESDPARTSHQSARVAPTDEQDELIQVAKHRGLQRVDDKGPILEILTQAGMKIEDESDLDQETLDRLPTWTQVQNMYGSKPIIHGLEKCEDFRNAVEPKTRFFGVAGTFNTGTNLVADLLKFNCQITERMEVYGEKSKGVRWQVPWGKHMMARYRDSDHTTVTDKDVPKDHILPVISIRDPFSWMQSMCRHTYAADWPHNKHHCPDLIATEADISIMPKLNALYGNQDDGDVEKLVPVDIKYNRDLTVHHRSLAHYYSEWYNDYLKVDYPRIMLRFEDMLFYGEEVTRTVCQCGGGVPVTDNGRSGRFAHVSESAKKGATAHGAKSQRTNLVGALIRYGSFANRTDSLTKDDLNAARRHLDPELMEAFGYRHPG